MNKRITLSQPSSLGLFRVAAGNAAIAAIPLRRESGTTLFYALHCSYYEVVTTLKAGAGNGFLRHADTRHTFNSFTRSRGSAKRADRM